MRQAQVADLVPIWGAGCTIRHLNEEASAMSPGWAKPCFTEHAYVENTCFVTASPPSRSSSIAVVRNRYHVVLFESTWIPVPTCTA